jgi:hypothetical protein
MLKSWTLLGFDAEMTANPFARPPRRKT